MISETLAFANAWSADLTRRQRLDLEIVLQVYAADPGAIPAQLPEDVLDALGEVCGETVEAAFHLLERAGALTDELDDAFDWWNGEMLPYLLHGEGELEGCPCDGCVELRRQAQPCECGREQLDCATAHGSELHGDYEFRL